ncbi:hypothetical protein MMUR_10760 [Mycolicibacterium murale]|uniref:DUF222 domain-containing protein n=1 Tax=Mycolicibacterium murale TaxID=182220 RepID=A0A7I9WI10_9MYCO|nr:hypothetical protein MMUR_10760 [Mycolicibacterium murale]
MLAALTQIETLTAQMNRLSIDAFSDAELLALQQRREAITRAQPALDHRVYQRITSQSSPISLGAKNYAAVLSQRLRISTSEARRRLDEAASFGPRTSLTGEPLAPTMPTFARGQAQGLIGAEHIKHLRWFFRELPGFVDFQTRANAEAQLAQHACELGPAEFRTAAAHMLYLLNQDGELSDEDRQALAYIRVGKQRPDGMRPFEGLLTPEAWATLEPLMERNAAPGMCNPADEHPCLDGEPTEEQIRNDTRTTGKRNHDALLALCQRMLTRATGTINGLPANVVITVSLTDLEKGTGHGLTVGGTLLPIADVLKLAAHCRPWLALFDGHGLPLHLGRARRTATLAQRLMLLAKHRGCTMPGCTASAYRSQVHHANQDWKDGGRTDIDDLTLACGPEQSHGRDHRLDHPQPPRRRCHRVDTSATPRLWAIPHQQPPPPGTDHRPRRRPVGQLCLDHSLDPVQRGGHVPLVAPGPQLPAEDAEQGGQQALGHAERLGDIGATTGRRREGVMPVVDRPIPHQYLEAELAPGITCGDAADGPVHGTDLVALDVAAEPGTQSRTRCAVQPFGLEHLGRELRSVAHVGDNVPHVLGNRIHVDGHRSVHLDHQA